MIANLVAAVLRAIWNIWKAEREVIEVKVELREVQDAQQEIASRPRGRARDIAQRLRDEAK